MRTNTERLEQALEDRLAGCQENVRDVLDRARAFPVIPQDSLTGYQTGAWASQYTENNHENDK